MDELWDDKSSQRDIKKKTAKKQNKHIKKGQKHLGELWDDQGPKFKKKHKINKKGQKKRNEHNKKGQNISQ